MDEHGADLRRIRTALRICHGYTCLNMNTRVSAVCSARRIHPNRVEFDLSGQRTRIPRVVRAVCECRLSFILRYFCAVWKSDFIVRTSSSRKHCIHYSACSGALISVQEISYGTCSCRGSKTTAIYSLNIDDNVHVLARGT